MPNLSIFKCNAFVKAASCRLCYTIYSLCLAASKKAPSGPCGWNSHPCGISSHIYQGWYVRLIEHRSDCVPFSRLYVHMAASVWVSLSSLTPGKPAAMLWAKLQRGPRGKEWRCSANSHVSELEAYSPIPVEPLDDCSSLEWYLDSNLMRSWARATNCSQIPNSQKLR